jgi:hypothetical protein
VNSDAIPVFGELPKFEERQDFIFIGNFLHEPNWNAVQYLKETIWPLIKTNSNCCLFYLWCVSIPKVLQLHNAKEVS